MSTIPEQTPPASGCIWPVDPACGGEFWTALEEDAQIRAASLATATLRRLTAYRVGGCPVTIRPQPSRGRCFLPGLIGTWNPALRQHGTWLDVGTSEPWEVLLPPPVGRLDEVKVDGTPLDLADVRIDDGHRLVWQGDGPVPWPSNQDQRLPLTEPGTWSVTYLNAYPVDSLGACAHTILAVEFAKAAAADKRCRLPAGVTAITRQGVSMEIVSGAFPDGLTGIKEVDSYTALWNPRGRTHPTRIWSPDMPRHRTVQVPTPPVVPGGGLDGGTP